MKKETKRKKKSRTAMKKEELILDSYFMNKKWIDTLNENDDDDDDDDYCYHHSALSFQAIILVGFTRINIQREAQTSSSSSFIEGSRGELLIMTQKKEEDDGGSNNRSFPQWDNLYTNEATIGSLPWYNKDLDDDLREYLDIMKITKGRFLDLGTGPATHAIELSKLGFQITATDLSENAISRAKRMSKGIEFIVDDILDSKLKEIPLTTYSTVDASMYQSLHLGKDMLIS